MDLIKISSRIKSSIKRMLPKNYSVESALQSAYLVLLETKDKNKQPALSVCTQESVYNALLDMVVQGLNPVKKQCYFVVYENKLQLIRSYMGSMMVAKQVDSNIKDIRAEVVYEGDKLLFDIVNGQKKIKEHVQSIDSLENKIKAAYAIAVNHEDKIIYTEIMSMLEIKESWKNSKTNVDRPDSNHKRFPHEMAKRTVINRLCKIIINTSDDRELLSYNEAPNNDIKEVLPEKKLIDFSDEPPMNDETPMATKDQAMKIYNISKELNFDDKKMFDEIGGFIGRDIEKLSELTQSEAMQYIDILKETLNPEVSKPDWA